MVYVQLLKCQRNRKRAKARWESHQGITIDMAPQPMTKNSHLKEHLKNMLFFGFMWYTESVIDILKWRGLLPNRHR